LSVLIQVYVNELCSTCFAAVDIELFLLLATAGRQSDGEREAVLQWLMTEDSGLYDYIFG
jgi:hypothetical protein